MLISLPCGNPKSIHDRISDAYMDLKANWNIEPTRVLLGPSEYLELCCSLGPFKHVVKYRGWDITCKPKPGIEFDIPPDRVSSFLTRR